MQEYNERRKEKKRKTKTRTRIRIRKKNKTEIFHSFFQSILPFLKEMWTDRCINRNTPVLGGRIVAEYDSLSKKVNHLYIG